MENPRALVPVAACRLVSMHPCLSCGACCAQYRVAFHWMESDEAVAGGVPAEFSERLDAHRLCMRGTYAPPIRCIALEADIGRHSRCTIHPRRPSVCREVEASWESGRPDAQCDRARIAHGLPVLTAGDWRWRDDADNDDGGRDESPDGGSPDDNGDNPPTPRLPPIAA